MRGRSCGGQAAPIVSPSLHEAQNATSSCPAIEYSLQRFGALFHRHVQDSQPNQLDHGRPSCFLVLCSDGVVDTQVIRDRIASDLCQSLFELCECVHCGSHAVDQRDDEGIASSAEQRRMERLVCFATFRRVECVARHVVESLPHLVEMM